MTNYTSPIRNTADKTQPNFSHADQASTISLAKAGLCALRYDDDAAARAFYDRHHPPVFVLDDREQANPVSYYIYKSPESAVTLIEGIELYSGEVPLNPDEVEIEGDLADAPELPAEFFQQALKRSPFHDIPDQLKLFDQWVLWRYEERDGKQTKLPIQPTGVMAKSNDPATWSSFERVSKTFSEGSFSGIGYVLSERDGLAGIDLDKCYDPVSRAFTKPEAEEIVRHALELGTYVEISPSGTGIRIFIEGSLQRSGKAPGKMSWIEAYDHNSVNQL